MYGNGMWSRTSLPGKITDYHAVIRVFRGNSFGTDWSEGVGAGPDLIDAMDRVVVHDGVAPAFADCSKRISKSCLQGRVNAIVMMADTAPVKNRIIASGARP